MYRLLYVETTSLYQSRSPLRGETVSVMQDPTTINSCTHAFMHFCVLKIIIVKAE